MFQNVSFSSSLKSMYEACRDSVGAKATNTLFSLFSSFLLLPLYILVLSVGVQRWRRQRSVAATTRMSHTDFFTYNMMIMELLGVVASVVYTFSIYMESNVAFKSGMFLFSTTLPAQTLFHALTCVERHLAVVHPLTYRSLRETLGVRVRTISSGCVWLLSLGWMVVTAVYLPGFPTIPFFSGLGVCVLVICFCCLSVLRVLTLSGPGQEEKEQVQKVKQRAFHMIVSIMAALLLRTAGLLMCLGLGDLAMIKLEDWCTLMDSGIWMTVPSSLVLPLLFLHRAGRLWSCRKDSG